MTARTAGGDSLTSTPGVVMRFGTTLAAVFGLAVTLPAPAAAQYYPRPSGYYPGLQGYPGLQTYLQPGFQPGVYFFNPYLTGPYATALNRPSLPSIYGPSLYGPSNITYGYYGAAPYGYQPGGLRSLAGYQGNYLSGGVGYGGGGANPIAVEQARLARQAANKAGGGDARKAIADQWDYEQNARPAAAKPANPAAPVPEVSADAILSGDALNALIAPIAALEAGGARAESPLFPAAVLGAVEYGPGAAGDLLTVLKDGRPEPPPAIAGPEWAAARAGLSAAANPVADAVLAGKRPDPAAADKLAAEVKKARTELAPVVRDAGFTPAAELVRYLNGLDALARSGRDQDSAGVYRPTWPAVGATASDLVKHFTRHGLRFAAARPAGAEAYTALYYGLAGYKQGLDRKK